MGFKVDLLKQNVLYIAQELHASGFRGVGRFVGPEDLARGANSASLRALATLEERVGRLPQTLRSIYEVLDGICLMGDLDSVCFLRNHDGWGEGKFGTRLPDPLVLLPPSDVLDLLDRQTFGEGDPVFLEIAPCTLHKHRFSGGPSDGVWVPSNEEDPTWISDSVPPDTKLTQYLRWVVLECVGFAGFSYPSRLPSQLVEIKKGLVDF
jgi:hypothetical protein